MAVKELQKYLNMNNAYFLFLRLTRITTFFFITPYKELKSHRITFSKFKFISTALLSVSIALTALIIILNLEPYENLKANPYMLLGYLRLMTFFWYSVLSMAHVNMKHGKIINVLNMIRELDEVLLIKRNELRRLKIFIVAQFAFATAGTLIITLLIFSGKSGNFKFLPLIGVAIVLPETANVYFLSFALLIGFYLDSVHHQLSNLSSEVSARKYKTIYT